MPNACSRLFTISVLTCCAAHAETQSRPAVVELFTSQGCSSCPPAEAYIGEVSRQKTVLALSFHVDYWDDLGWKDPFSLASSTERQRAYSIVLGRSSVYTPQVVVDGTDDFVGTDRRSIGDALAAARTGVGVDIERDGEDLVVTLSAGEVMRSEVLLVPYLRKAVSAVGRGENTGRTLEEFNIVRELRTLGPWNGEASSFRVPLASLPRDATDLAILLQSAGQHRIIGAVTQTLR